jgi:spermidine synthase
MDGKNATLAPSSGGIPFLTTTPPRHYAARMPLIDTAPIPGGGELRLFRDGEHYVIKLADGGDLMSTRQHGSEEALAQLACARIARRPGARVLVGGLGLGYTLAAALRHLQADAEVTVAELVPGVVTWNRELLGGFAGNPLGDVRTRVHVGDVAGLIRGAREQWDAILLDVDNGPDGLSQAVNSRLYSVTGLRAAHAALRAGGGSDTSPPGVLAVWSAHPDPRFTQRLRDSSFTVGEVPVRALGKRGMRHHIWLATRTGR